MYNFITVGYDCSPSGALRGLGLREAALPFDWVVSDISSLQRCVEDNFKQFHTNLHFNTSHSRLIDAYGFEFPHDYPHCDVSDSYIGEGAFGEAPGKTIIADWHKYYDIAKAKYARRIERFKTIMQNTLPIIVLSRHSYENIIKLKQTFKTYYNKTNIVFVNATTDNSIDSKILKYHI